MKATVKKDTCIGCGACTVIANNIFEIGDDGLAEVITADNDNDNKNVNIEKIVTIPDEEKENVMDAKESCPTGAIEVTDTDK